jgi:hypothetical protein
MITAATGPTHHGTADEPQLVAERLDAAEKSARGQALPGPGTNATTGRKVFR